MRILYENYLEHYGVLGMKWGIRRTPEQLGHKRVKKVNARKLKDYKGPLYFISEKDMDGKTINPRVPDNFFTKNGFEDAETKRVSFAPSVGQCLQGMSYNVKNKRFYVYEPDGSHDVWKPTKNAVPDSGITGELWIKDPVKLKRVGVIECTGDTGEDGHKFTYGDGKTAELYDWNYTWKKTKK